MIKIGETHTVVPCAVLHPLSDRDAMIRSEVLATEAVKRLVEAALNVVASEDLDDVLSSYRELKAAAAPFTETEEGR